MRGNKNYIIGKSLNLGAPSDYDGEKVDVVVNTGHKNDGVKIFSAERWT